MDMRHLMTAAAIGGSLAFAGTAQAASINSLFDLSGTVKTRATDPSAEYIADVDGLTGADNQVNRVKALDGSGNVTLEEGDVIRGMFNITTIDPGSFNPRADAGVEWKGLFSLRVGSIVDPTPGDTTNQDATATFEADPLFGDWLEDMEAAFAGTDLGPAPDSLAMVRFFQQETAGPVYDPNTALTGSPDENVATTIAPTGSEFYWDLGIDTANNPDDFWIADDLQQTFDPTNSSGIAGNPANFAVSLVTNNSGINVVPHTWSVGGATFTSDFEGSSGIFGYGDPPPDDDAGFHALDDTTLVFTAIPTPAAVGPGLALIGLLGMVRNRRRQTA